jgi:hypothetical protein
METWHCFAKQAKSSEEPGMMILQFFNTKRSFHASCVLAHRKKQKGKMVYQLTAQRKNSTLRLQRKKFPGNLETKKVDL